MRGKLKRPVRCDPAAHKEHLCYLLAHRRLSRAQSLVGDGRFACGVCGRRAERPENLCQPLASRTGA